MFEKYIFVMFMEWYSVCDILLVIFSAWVVLSFVLGKFGESRNILPRRFVSQKA